MRIAGQHGAARTIIITREEVLALEEGEAAANQARLALALMLLAAAGGQLPKRPLAPLATATTVQKVVSLEILEAVPLEEVADTEIDFQEATEEDIDIIES